MGCVGPTELQGPFGWMLACGLPPLPQPLPIPWRAWGGEPRA